VAGSVETTTNKIMEKTLNFDYASVNYAQFMVQMPKSWDGSAVTFKFAWSHPVASTDFGVVMSLQAVSIGDNETLDSAFGTAVNVTDTGGTTNNHYLSIESAAVNIAGSAAGEYVVFQLARQVADGADTLAVVARLEGVQVFYTVSAVNDA